MNRRNYSKEAESIIQRELQDHKVQRLLLHSCCAPCSSHCLEYLREYFDVTVFYYNPNITEQADY
ncbi:MAG: epoxyqueuosine reductase QueH, partial [Lachnospiraceae bacterium]|nr:epoxyqueuosine reductase QueH [Lachnospiraceae bacterium]